MKIQRVNVRVKKLHEDAVIPRYARMGDAGFDLYAAEDVFIPPNGIAKVRTGLAFGLPEGYEIQVRPRSGLSYTTALRVSNAPGTVDCGFRGEVAVLLDNSVVPDYEINYGAESEEDEVLPRYGFSVLTIDGEEHTTKYSHPVNTVWIRKGDRIAQGVLAEVPMARFEVVEELDETERGAGGFGSTGVQ
jgi:dUTP pyrophosphatase